MIVLPCRTLTASPNLMSQKGTLSLLVSPSNLLS